MQAKDMRIYLPLTGGVPMLTRGSLPNPRESAQLTNSRGRDYEEASLVTTESKFTGALYG